MTKALRTAFVAFQWLFAIALFVGVLSLYHRAQKAEVEVDRLTTLSQYLQVTLEQTRASETVVVEYVDRVEVIKEKGQTIIKEVPVYVTVEANSRCVIPDGFVWLHNAAAENQPPTTSPGNADASTSGVTLATVAETVTGNYTGCHATAAQLTALQDWVKLHGMAQ